jgi:peptidyl-dipeptidase Dcp
MEFDTPYNSAPFSKIKTTHFLPAFKTALAESKKNIAAIVSNPEPPNFKNTVEALEFSSLRLDRISSLFFNLNAAETNDAIQNIAQEVSPLLTAHSNDVALNKSLFNRLKIVYNRLESLNLTTEQKTLLEKKYKGFVRNGANLNSNDKTRLREIDKELSVSKLTFGEHLLAETNKFRLEINKASHLEGLPENLISTAKLLGEKEEKKGWLFTLDYPSYVPFMTYAKNRTLRKKMAIAFGKKGFQNDNLDNQNLLLKIAKLRHIRANLLGYKTHADYVLEERMAKSPETVLGFLEDLKAKALTVAQSEYKELSAFAKELDGVKTLQKWDSAYYSEKLKKKRFDIDDALLKPFFKLENVLEGAFAIAKKLFQIQFIKTTEVDTYHDDVMVYKVIDKKGDLVALFYADFFPRSGKRAGAWMTSFKPQYQLQGQQHRPHVSIVCNFTKPTKKSPSLLTFNEVTTLFHEFGHALHGMLANTTYPSLSGTNVAWDFVELPSQLMENWCYEKEALELFARHYESSEVIPMHWIEKIKAAGRFQQGMQTLRQLSFSLLDMSWHGQDPSSIKDVKTHEKNVFKSLQLFPDVKENCMSTAFAHIFQGGYSSGYYSYKWAEVLEADAFAYFKKNQVFDPIIASKLKTHILSQGGIENPEVLYKRFRGKKASNKALLERAGLQ